MRLRGWIGAGVTLLLGAAIAAGFLYWDRTGAITRMIMNSGPWLASFLGILLMTIFCIIPVPSEFLIIILMRVFGAWQGALYSWGASMIGAIVTFVLARRFGGRLLQKFITPQRFDQVSEWIGDRGRIGLILARIVPLPFIVVNYTAGVVKTVRVWDYIWTSAIGGIPYYVGFALVFLGVSEHITAWLTVGGILMLIVWLGGYLYNRHVHKAKRWAH